MRSKLKYTLIIVVFLAGCNSDQLTKHIARKSLKNNQPLVVLRGFVDLCYAENTGMAFSLLSNLSPSLRKSLLVSAPLLITIFFSYFIWRFRVRPFTALLPFILIVSGASGNLLDRMRYGHVVDFIYLHVRDVFHWHIFNIADVLIFVGGLLLILQYGFKRNKHVNENS